MANTLIHSYKQVNAHSGVFGGVEIYELRVGCIRQDGTIIKPGEKSTMLKSHSKFSKIESKDRNFDISKKEILLKSIEDIEIKIQRLMEQLKELKTVIRE